MSDKLLALFPDHADIRDISQIMDKQLQALGRIQPCTCDAYDFPHRKLSGRCYGDHEYAATNHDWKRQAADDAGVPEQGEI